MTFQKMLLAFILFWNVLNTEQKLPQGADIHKFQLSLFVSYLLAHPLRPQQPAGGVL